MPEHPGNPDAHQKSGANALGDQVGLIRVTERIRNPQGGIGRGDGNNNRSDEQHRIVVNGGVHPHGGHAV